jgi:hypothetical protein
VLGFESYNSGPRDWIGLIIVFSVFVLSALAAGWAASRAPKRPLVAGVVLWGAFALFGFLAVGYKNETKAGPIHGILLLPPLAFFFGGLWAFIGHFTSPAPATAESDPLKNSLKSGLLEKDKEGAKGNPAGPA